LNFEFSDEQRQLHDAVERYLSEQYGFERFQSIKGSAAGWDRTVWRGLADLGVLAITVPVEQGGLGFGPLETLAMMGDCGRSLLLEPQPGRRDRIDAGPLSLHFASRTASARGQTINLTGAEFRVLEVLMQQVGMGDQHRGTGIPQDVGDLLRLEMPVHRDAIGAELHRGVGRLDEGDVVAHQDAHAVTLCDAEPLQSARDPRGAIRDVGVGAAAVAADDALEERGRFCHWIFPISWRALDKASSFRGVERSETNPESRDSPMRNCASEVRCFASPRNDDEFSNVREPRRTLLDIGADRLELIVAAEQLLLLEGLGQQRRTGIDGQLVQHSLGGTDGVRALAGDFDRHFQRRGARIVADPRGETVG